MREAQRKAKAARRLAVHEAFPETRGAEVSELWQQVPAAAAKDAKKELVLSTEKL